MGLRIQNNIAALNAHRQLTISDAGLSKSLERLSSGYRINRAADDAAGLSISQGLRADIASYKVASRNTSEANALLQVGEGALDQIGNMLTRLKELATQASSANAASDLDKIDAEAQKLIAEIDRIAESTEYSGTKLIDGSFGVDVSAKTGTISGGAGYVGISGMKASEKYTISDTVVGSGYATITITTGDVSQTVISSVAAGDNTKTIEFSALGVQLTVNSDFDTSAELEGKITAASTGSATFQVGAENAGTSQIALSLGNATKEYLGKTSGGAGNAISAIDLTTATGAQDALDTVDYAISDLGKIRGDIGAAQNRLGYAAANLATTIENVTAAESVIRDVDMASEMTTFTKNQILLQAGTAMLAQANMAPQQVLSLFG
ncbi:MAG: flagellin [Deltaproteobacteria bacterium HGW-Deltaproteobacteria-15]|jgi:flagellin|nr:MAG: flagellin [Deltaproteobacteria bacterium HGW-Deltaproteobacteria-15]